jgi:hypothetical protein
MANFHHISVLTMPNDLKVVHWLMDRNFTVPEESEARFYIDTARSGGPWTCLNPDSPVTDSCFFEDPTRYLYAMEPNLYYRVRVEIVPTEGSSSSDETFQTFTSLPEQANGVMRRENLLIAKEIVKKEYLRLKKKGGRQGFLLKRKEWGTKCPVCRDFDTEGIVDGSCPTCFGTGIVGGYYPGIEYWLETTPAKRDQKISEQGLGTVNYQQISARAVAYPWVSSMDLWVDSRSNERYIIRSIQTLAEMDGKPLVYQLELRRLPDTDVSKTVPIERVLEEFEIETRECPSETVPVMEKLPEDINDIVKSTETTTTGGWRRGLEDENW